MSDCIFCRIVEQAIPATRLYEDDQCLAFEDVNPQAPVHALVVPKRHIASVQDLADGEDTQLLGHLLLTCSQVAAQKGIVASGYRVVTNSGREAGQTVFHLHLHVLGGRPMSWPPG